MNSEDTLHSGLPPASDRMLTTCFLAALFHAIVILGVTFSSSRQDEDLQAPALEVVLVNDRGPKVAKNPHARYIAQRNQSGSGNAADEERTVLAAPAAAAVDGAAGGGRRAAAAAQADDDEVVGTRDTRSKAFYFASHEHAQTPQQLEPRPNAGIAPNDGIELRLRGEPTREHWVSADTREADVAVYLDGWRRKIERVGTMNFPDAARRRKLAGTPVIEVTIGADGTLLQTVVRHSSGHSQIDEAAMRILALAAPYDAFPAALSAQHDRIRIAYEWQFLGGAAHDTGALFSR